MCQTFVALLSAGRSSFLAPGMAVVPCHTDLHFFLGRVTIGALLLTSGSMMWFLLCPTVIAAN
jgi:hypothetical protein